MYEIILSLHSYWAYLVLIVITITAVTAIVKALGDKEYENNDFRRGLFSLIVSHIQLLIGLVLYFISPRFELWSELGGKVMSNSLARLYLVEHPFVNIIAIALITMGYSKHKRKLTSKAKLKTMAIFYSSALILLLSRIPWGTWLS
ncbi:hypothetical protein [Pseudotamlana carrageenivorans]|uniref:50S ribosomal protein L27 n=1 Tax=Pseudotamlana carrageenivorans TaxID=2069432 RepID=A0A2I7SFN7_9FLAO|nr:hypothetical protein [Tamlana carrageenivorans]AUS04729.1 hypothetical protein C1A40_04220 [Tamlana carrageenivorans]